MGSPAETGETERPLLLLLPDALAGLRGSLPPPPPPQLTDGQGDQGLLRVGLHLHAVHNGPDGVEGPLGHFRGPDCPVGLAPPCLARSGALPVEAEVDVEDGGEACVAIHLDQVRVHL